MSIVDEIFDPVLGKPAWNVQHTISSCLDFEFGEPHLEIREPREAKPGASKRVQRYLARREVKVRGAWHLWIEWGEWRAFSQGKLIGDSSSSKRILKKVASELDGQALVRVTVTGQAHTNFEFDLGGKLEISPGAFDDKLPEMNSEWSLSEPTGKAFTLRFDGCYCHKSERKWIRPEDWLPLCP
jgi:hypothetical protein